MGCRTLLQHQFEDGEVIELVCTGACSNKDGIVS